MSDLTRLPVLAQSPYDVVVGHHILDQVPRMLGETQRVAICHTSELVHVAEQIRDLLNDSEVTLIELPDGEAAKEASVAVRAWNTLGEAGFNSRGEILLSRNILHSSRPNRGEQSGQRMNPAEMHNCRVVEAVGFNRRGLKTKRKCLFIPFPFGSRNFSGVSCR